MSKQESRREAGLCAYCGIVPSVKYYCDKCREMTNRKIAVLRDKRKVAGRCVICGQPRVNACYCADCRDYGNRLRRQRDLKRKKDHGIE